MLKELYEECSDFFKESGGMPLIKYLPSDTDGYRKVKVRWKNANKLSKIEKTFNQTFQEHYDLLLQRAVFVYPYTVSNRTKIVPNHEPFYVFPPNGFKFMYNKNIETSTPDYISTFGNYITEEKDIKPIFQYLIENAYSKNDLRSGILSGCEIIIYDVQYYYAIRTSLIENYYDFFYTQNSNV